MRHSFLTLALAAFLTTAPQNASAYIDPMSQAVAEAVSENDMLAEFYRSRKFAPLWLGAEAAERRAALIWALETVEDHGLPADRYNIEALKAGFAAAENGADLGELDVQLSATFLKYAEDVSTGMLNPRAVDRLLVLDKPEFDGVAALNGMLSDAPYTHIQDMWPENPVYDGLLVEKRRLETAAARGGWGPEVRASSLEYGDTGTQVINLRNRLMRMGYLERTATAVFDEDIEGAVQAFQAAQGFEADGVAGGITLKALNRSIPKRMEQVLVGLERQRWMNRELEPRHVLVNLAEFRAYVYDDGKITFETDAVVGKNTGEKRTPEFSDEMTHMVINPTWHVPRSLAVKYLPTLQAGGAQYLRLYRGGRQISRASVDLSQYTASTFPFDLKQPPSPNNALGLVKFMFPNRWNIYLHDTPEKHLFGRTVRTYSSGCVRLARPFEFAYHLLGAQEEDPKAFFHDVLDRGLEEYVYLDQPIGVHIVYWTAWVDAEGRARFHEDTYGRDAQVWRALRNEGVVLPSLGS